MIAYYEVKELANICCLRFLIIHVEFISSLHACYPDNIFLAFRCQLLLIPDRCSCAGTNCAATFLSNLMLMSHSQQMANSRKPPGLRLLGGAGSLRTYQTLVLVLTFLAYTCFHMTRKIPSIVKSALDPQTKVGFSHWGRLHASRNALTTGWLPFNTADGSALLGEIDVAFLAAYSAGMFFAGHIGDRMDLRVFLTVGMAGTAVFTTLFGAGYWLNVHSFYYFLVIQMVSGLFQSVGWPSVVAVVGNWFGKSKRGLIMGIWNAHTSVGNIAGSLLAAFLLKFGWGWSFAVPSLIMALVGLMVYVFLPVSPEAMEIDSDGGELNCEKDAVKEPLLEPGQEVKHSAVGFLEAWRIPGVAPFALCLFFSKLVAYTFLYWLPFYISHTRKSSYSFNDVQISVCLISILEELEVWNCSYECAF
jgi:MFS transporter, OPA family, solute carrier family 37 (glycerol-3-phosphate transporter), member 1/2